MIVIAVDGSDKSLGCTRVLEYYQFFRIRNSNQQGKN